MIILVMSIILASIYIYASTRAEVRRQELKWKSRLDRLSGQILFPPLPPVSPWKASFKGVFNFYAMTEVLRVTSSRTLQINDASAAGRCSGKSPISHDVPKTLGIYSSTSPDLSSRVILTNSNILKELDLLGNGSFDFGTKLELNMSELFNQGDSSYEKYKTPRWSYSTDRAYELFSALHKSRL